MSVPRKWDRDQGIALACFLQALRQMAPQILEDLRVVGLSRRKLIQVWMVYDFDDLPRFILDWDGLVGWARRWNLHAPALLVAAEATVCMWLNRPEERGWGKLWASQFRGPGVDSSPRHRWLASYQVLGKSWEEIAAREGVSVEEARKAATEVARQIGLTLRVPTPALAKQRKEEGWTDRQA